MAGTGHENVVRSNAAPLRPHAIAARRTYIPSPSAGGDRASVRRILYGGGARDTIRRGCASGAADGVSRDESGCAVRRQAAAAGEVSMSPAAGDAIRYMGAGSPLPATERTFFESRFGRDLSGVRIHDDGAAGRAALAIDARAFTLGANIGFAHGEYRPGTPGGRRLLAHELTHWLQQGPDDRIRRLIRSPYPWRGVVTPGIGANLRSAPDESDPENLLYAIPQGEHVTVLSAAGDWLKVSSTFTGNAVEGFIWHPLIDDAASLEMESSVGTTMVWKSSPGSGTDFEIWASAAVETPFPAVTATTSMNCWEAVLLSAFRSGAIDWNWIHHLYTGVPFADWAHAMTGNAGHVYAGPGPNAQMPQRGDIVFFDGMAHVALATGNGSEVFTFWPPPDTPFTPGGTTDKVKVFTIEDLVAWFPADGRPVPLVGFAAPSW